MSVLVVAANFVLILDIIILCTIVVFFTKSKKVKGLIVCYSPEPPIIWLIFCQLLLIVTSARHLDLLLIAQLPMHYFVLHKMSKRLWIFMDDANNEIHIGLKSSQLFRVIGANLEITHGDAEGEWLYLNCGNDDINVNEFALPSEVCEYIGVCVVGAESTKMNVYFRRRKNEPFVGVFVVLLLTMINIFAMKPFF